MSSLLLWLLLLVKVVTAAVYFYPNTRVVEVCAGDNLLQLTCVTDTGTLVWRVGDITKIFSSVLPVNQPSLLGDHITVYLTNVTSSHITSVANITGDPLALNETMVQCRDSGNDDANSKEKTILVSTVLLAPTNLRFIALSFTAAMFKWTKPLRCGDHIDNYTIRTSDNHSYNVTISFNTSAYVTGLRRGVQYKVSVYGNNNDLDAEVAKILMTLDVPEKVVNLTVVSSLENITLSWQHQTSSRPPVENYTVQHNVTTNGSVSQMTTEMTNITIDGAQPGHVYYIEVTAVNILGPGPPTSTVLWHLTQSTDTDMEVYQVYIIVGTVAISFLLFGICIFAAVKIMFKQAKQISNQPTLSSPIRPKSNITANAMMHVYEVLDREEDGYTSSPPPPLPSLPPPCIPSISSPPIRSVHFCQSLPPPAALFQSSAPLCQSVPIPATATKQSKVLPPPCTSPSPVPPSLALAPVLLSPGHYATASPPCSPISSEASSSTSWSDSHSRSPSATPPPTMPAPAPPPVCSKAALLHQYEEPLKTRKQ